MWVRYLSLKLKKARMMPFGAFVVSMNTVMDRLKNFNSNNKRILANEDIRGEWKLTNSHKFTQY